MAAVELDASDDETDAKMLLPPSAHRAGRPDDSDVARWTSLRSLTKVS